MTHNARAPPSALYLHTAGPDCDRCWRPRRLILALSPRTVPIPSTENPTPDSTHSANRHIYARRQPRRQRASERRAKSVSVFFRGFVKRGRKGSTNLHVEGVRRHRRDCGAHSSGHAPHACSNFAWGVNGALGRPDQYLATPSYPRHAISVFLYRRRPWVQWKPRED